MYKINYSPETSNRFPAKKRRNLNFKFVVLGIVFTFLISSVFLFRSEIADFLIPGDSMVTKSAFSEFLKNVHNGESISDAALTFCREIIENANVS